MSSIKWDYAASNGRTDITVVDINGVPIAIVHDAADVPKVAAAPDMLEALEAVEVHFGGWNGPDLPRGMLAAIRNAIKKARGQS